MIPPESQQVTVRFFKALDFLIQTKALRGKAPFCKKYGIDKRNFYLVAREPHRISLKIQWMIYLIRDYNISSRWLLTGEGGIQFIREK